MTISNCGHDENGKYSGGKAGDQTGGEYTIRSWYNRPWNCVLRHPKTAIQNDIAKLARQAANNDHIGYDQSQRGTFWAQLKKADSYLPSKITTDCEADCSSSTAAIVKAVGYRKKDSKLSGISTELWTGNMKSALKSAGFEVLTDSKYLSSAAYLMPGDVLLNEEHHVAINLTKGKKAASGSSADASTASVGGKTYKVTAKSGLNYRKGAGAKYAAVGAYNYGEKVTISETKTVNNREWGKGSNGYWCVMEYLKAI